MNDNLVKKIFFYDNNLYKKIEKEKHRKWFLKIFIFLIIEVISVLYLIYWINHKTPSGIKETFAIISMILAFISIFPLFYNVLTITQIFNNKVIFSDRCYVITNDNKFLSLKFTRDLTLLMNTSSESIFITILKLIYNKNNINADNERIKELALSNNVNLDDLYSCIQLINVYNIKEFYNRYEIKCDYEDKIEDENHLKETITIYKYFNGYEEIYKYLIDASNYKKEEINENQNKKNHNLVSFALSACDNKTIYWVAAIVTLYYLLTDINSLYAEFTIMFFLFFASVYVTKEAKKNASIESDTIKLNKKLKTDRIIMWILFTLSIVFSIIPKFNIKNLLLIYVTIWFFVILIILRFRKKEK